eukprot:c33810_g1_i1 orf=57-266(-)
MQVVQVVAFIERNRTPQLYVKASRKEHLHQPRVDTYMVFTMPCNQSQRAYSSTMIKVLSSFHRTEDTRL